MHINRTGNFQVYLKGCVGRDSSVGIATRYRLDGPGIEIGRGFPHPSRPILELPASYTTGTGSLSRG